MSNRLEKAQQKRARRAIKRADDWIAQLDTDPILLRRNAARVARRLQGPAADRYILAGTQTGRMSSRQDRALGLPPASAEPYVKHSSVGKTELPLR